VKISLIFRTFILIVSVVAVRCIVNLRNIVVVLFSLLQEYFNKQAEYSDISCSTLWTPSQKDRQAALSQLSPALEALIKPTFALCLMADFRSPEPTLGHLHCSLTAKFPTVPGGSGN